MNSARALPVPLCIRLLQAAKEVIGTWEAGDLAGAVNRLREALEAVEDMYLLLAATPLFKARGRRLYSLAKGKETCVATAASKRLATSFATALNSPGLVPTSRRKSGEGISLRLALAAPELAHALCRLINCPAMNLDTWRLKIWPRSARRSTSTSAPPERIPPIRSSASFQPRLTHFSRPDLMAGKSPQEEYENSGRRNSAH